MPRVVLVRHGESELNAANRNGEKVFCGQFETPLTERGRQQAREVGEQLAQVSELRIRYAVSSCHQRAVETLEILAQELPPPVTVFSPMPGFNERSLGVFEGRTEAEVFREFPEYRDQPEFQRFRNDFEQKAPGGENLTEVTHRMWAAWREARQLASADVLVVSHGTALQAWLGRALGLAQAEILNIKIPNATPIVLEYAAETDDSLPNPGYRLLSTNFNKSATLLE